MTSSYALAARTFAAQVAELPADRWDGPGLGSWDLRSLVGHTSRSLVTVDTYLDRPAAQEVLRTPEDYLTVGRALVTTDPDGVAERGRQAGVALGRDPATTVRELVDRVLVRVETAGDPVIETIAGGMRLSCYLPTRTFELVVHSLDIARAVDSPPPDWPQPVLLEVATIATRAVVATGRGPDLILALTGRGPLPVGFSVV